MNILLVLYLIIIVAPIGTIVHEIGHVLGAKAVGAEKVTLTIGSGKKIGTLTFLNLVVSVHALFFIGGFVKGKRKKPYNNSQLILIAIGGPISNIIFGFLFYFFYLFTLNDYIKLLFLFNLWLAIVNIIPFKLGNKHSDGYTIWQIIRKNKHIL